MQTKKRFLSLVGTGTRLVLLVAISMAALISNVSGVAAAPALNLQSVTVGPQSGALVAGTAGSATYSVAVTRSNGSPDTLTMSVSGLPAGATASFGAPTGWSPVTGTGSQTYTLTISVTNTVGAGAYSFDVLASGQGPDATGVGALTVLAPQTITFDPLPDMTIYDPDFTVSASASSNLPVSFIAAGECNATGDLVHLTGIVGSCTITASQAGDATYAAAEDVSQTFAITPFTGIELYAVSGSTTLAGQSVTVWGYNSSNAPVSQPGGPTLIVNQGDAVSIALHDELGESTALLLQGQDMIPDTTGVAPGAVKVYNFTANRPGTYLYEAGLLPNTEHQTAMGLYGVLIVRPNSVFASVSGVNTADDLTGMTLTDSAADFTGLDYLVGGLLSNTTDNSSCTIASLTATTLACAAPLAGGTANTWVISDTYTASANPSAGFAYADLASAYDDEAVLVLSELDPVLNNSADPAAFDIRDYAPKYFLINGQVYPDTTPIPALAGDQVLLRYVNAGLLPYSMGLLGLRQVAIAIDGSPFAHGRTVVAETLAPGQTADMITGIPAAAAAGSQYALYDANLMLHNNKANNTGGFGGMLTFLTVSGTPPTGDTTGPATSDVSLTPSSVSATVSDAGRGDSNVTAAEFYIDVTSGNGTAMNGAFGVVTVSVSGVISPTLSGSHIVYVRGMDAAGNWGPFASALINNDTTGPATSGLGLSPNPSDGSVDVNLSATADDTASGGSNIAAAEYWIDSGAAVAMTVSPLMVQVAGLTATIPAATVNGLSEGAHVVSVSSQDSMGNWGAAATITLTVDRIGPTTSNVNAAPNPNNGALGINSSTPAVRVTAEFSGLGTSSPSCVRAAIIGAAGDGLKRAYRIFLPLVTNDRNVRVSTAVEALCPGAEGFIDMVGADGTGFIFLPSDGAFNTDAESGYVDIPLTTISTLSDGDHTITVHAKDTAGNWGTPPATTTLVIDKTAPTISNVTLDPATIALNTASVTLTVSATDAGLGVSGGQYWIDGSATPPATPTAFTGASATIDTSTLTGGAHTVYVRMQDAIGNWSAVSSVTLNVVQAVDDAQNITANTSATQTSDVAAPGVLANDEPAGDAGRTASLASAPVRTSGNGAGTITLSCPATLGAPATPAISGNTICTNGAYRVTLNGVGNNGNQRRSSKRGTFTFTYTETLNGVTATATVTITVQ